MKNEDLLPEEEEENFLPEEQKYPENEKELNEELYGTDSVEGSVSEAKKLEFGFSFNAQDGESGNENEDYGDLPTELKKAGHIYDPALSDGNAKPKDDQDEISDTIHIVKNDEVGFSYNEDDEYLKD